MPSLQPRLIGPQPLPPARLRISLPDGSMDPVWHRFFLALFARTGGDAGVDGLDMQTTTVSTETLAMDLSAMLALVDAPEGDAVPDPDGVLWGSTDAEAPEGGSPDGTLWASPEPEDPDVWAPCLLAEPV